MNPEQNILPSSTPRMRGNGERTYSAQQLREKFTAAWAAGGAQVILLASMEDLITLYYKSGGGLDDVCNTIATIGRVTDVSSLETPRPATFSQIWVRAAAADADTGAVWLEMSAQMGALVRDACESLIVVLDAGEIVACSESGRHPARPDPGQHDEMVCVAAPATANAPTAGHAGGPGKWVVCIIDPLFRPQSEAPGCGPGCRC